MHFDEILSKAMTSCNRPGDGDPPWVRISGEPEQATAVFEAVKGGLIDGGRNVRIFQAGSFGYYDLEPIVTVSKPGKPAFLYHRVTAAEASELIGGYLANDEMRADRALCAISEDRLDAIPRVSDLPLFTLQSRVALRNCGFIDPKNIDDYIAHAQGYGALSRVLQMDPADVVEALRAPVLGAENGRRVVDAMRALRDAQGEEKWLVCNCLDGNPRALTARLLLEGDPHAILEGVLVAAYAAGATHCIVAADNRSATGMRRITNALEQMKRYGLVGDGILGSSFSCEIEIRAVASSLVMVDDTALLRFLEGKQAMPVLRPPNSEVLRFSGDPCLVDTVEYFAKASALFQTAPTRPAIPGACANMGTRVVTLSGDIRHSYTIEVPLTTSIGTIVEEIGGGVTAGRSMKAVQVGGPAGSFLGPDDLNLPIGSESVERAGSDLGAGSIEVLDTGRCAVEVTEERMSYLQAQSCGKCVFCREGTLQLADILASVAGQGGTPQDVDLLRELGEGMRTGSICALGRTAANPVLSSLKLFRSEYDAHIKEKGCSATGRK